MEFFEKYSSNTYAGSGNQLYFNMNDGEVRTGRIFYKISAGGRYNYSLLFSNIIDSTYSDGSISSCNLICDEWRINSAKIAICSDITNPADFRELTFDGNKSKKVMPGEFFSSDPIELSFEKGEYLCLEIAFAGKMIPYHEESLLPVFIKTSEGWEYSKYMPFAAMIGCDRPVSKKIAFWGDSITQGIGTEINSYKHWNAVLSEKLGDKYSYWNLGIGYGRASDAASCGAWMYKAKQADIIFVCYGVNDILQGMSEQQIKSDLTKITDSLKKDGKTVILQTIPPFDYDEEKTQIWQKVNEYIKKELSKKADYVFDNVPYLCGDKPQDAKYGGHPNAEGCEIWANAFYEKIKDMF